MKVLDIPGHFDPRNAADFNYYSDDLALLDRAVEWAKRHSIKPAGGDKRNVHLLLIDVQKSFCHPEGTLFVAGRSGRGAIDDNVRICEFIYRNLGVIRNITTTMDTHFAFQIFFSSFWLNADGTHVKPHAFITTQDIRTGKVKPNPKVAWFVCEGNFVWLRKQVEFYTEELEKAGKYKLYLWPPHCLLGSAGHPLAGVIHEARLFHSFARGSQSTGEVKGGNELTENYSVLRPEVLKRWDDKPLAELNAEFLGTLQKADVLVIAGQAASHCVKSSIEDLLDQLPPDMVERVYILEDCMSSVTVPDGKGGFALDFTGEAEKALEKFRKAGMHVVKSTDEFLG